jgi:regulator of ribonuclease activity A
VDALSRIDFAVKALGSNPRKSEKHGTGCIDAVVSFGGVDLRSGAGFAATKIPSSFRLEHH